MERINEVEYLRYRVAELESALGINAPTRKLDMTKMQAKFLGLLLSKELMTREIFWASLYSDRDASCDHILNVMLTTMRKKLKPHDIEIKNSWGYGWFISPEHKAKLRELMA